MKPARLIITAVPLGEGKFSITADVTGPGAEPDMHSLTAILQAMPQTIQKLEATIAQACTCPECCAKRSGAARAMVN